jgi:hypothetical protein
VHESDLDVAIPLGAPPDKRQGGEEPSPSAKCSPAALGGCGVLFMGRAPPGQGPRFTAPPGTPI